MLDRKRYSQLQRWVVAFVFVLVLGVAVFAVSSLAGNEAPQGSQELIRVENRLSVLEQRLYGLETSVRTLEQQSRLSSATSRNTGNDEVRLLRSEIDTLQRRLADVECGVAKVDERTLTSSMRARRKSDDPCRQNSETPVTLPARP